MRSSITALCLLFLACTAPRPTRPEAPRSGAPVEATRVARRDAPAIEANWKERLDQPYVFIEHAGDYRGLGDAMRRLLQIAEDEGFPVDGPPFALFYDDPGRVAVHSLRARACLPVRERPGGLDAGLGYEVLPRSMVIYMRVEGSYAEVSRAYPALFEYAAGLGWSTGGPVREVYLVNPAAVESYSDLVTEVQIPWTRGG